MIRAQRFHLVDYPRGTPAPGDFELRAFDLGDPAEGQVQIETLFMSVDPYMRGRMTPGLKSYIPGFEKGGPLDGGAVGRVIASRDPSLAEGDIVVGFTGGWHSHINAPASQFTKVDASIAPLSLYLGVLGMPGLTAWVGLSEIIAPKAGETLYVSGAAGAVGAVVCQLGRARGMRVFGSAGSAAKCEWLETRAGVEKAFNYRDYDAMTLSKALAALAPRGIDGYFENVGGMQLEAILNVIAFGGRIAACGMISAYNDTAPRPGPWNLINIVPRSVKMQGFIVSNYMHLTPKFLAEVVPMVRAGTLVFEETVYEGLGRAPEAFIGLFSGENFGKAVIKVA